MELDITDFFNDCAPMDYFASVAEIGHNAGPDTWRAACDDAPDWPLLDTEEKRDAFRDHVRGFGAWDDDEIASWSDTELTALLIQSISGDIREAPMPGDAWDWTEYESLSSEGVVSGRLFKGDDGRVYYYIGD